MSFSRRDFLTTAALGSLALGVEAETGAHAKNGNGATAPSQQSGAKPGNLKRPIIICAGNGFRYLDRGYDFLSKGGDTLDAAHSGGDRTGRRSQR